MTTHEARPATHGHGDGAQRLRRRGILAAAGAVVAGIVAKRAARPVAAGTDGDVVLGADNPVTNNTPTRLLAESSFSSGVTAVFIADASASTGNVTGLFAKASGGTPAILGFATGVTTAPPLISSVGVHGVGGGSGVGVVGDSSSDFGVAGARSFSHGVAGVTNTSRSGLAGVHGFAPNIGNFGVIGEGVAGTGTGVVGVRGQNAQYGVVGMVSNATNTIAVYAQNQSTGAAPIAMRGDCINGVGIYGSTSAAGQVGVIGQTLVSNAFGLAGIANTDGSAAFAGGTTNANAFAASFQGHVQVLGGAFDVADAGNKHAIVPHPDGTYRTIYSVESPECWVEDFGTGTLVAGTAPIAFDKDFAALIHTDDYHVFITEHGGHNGLHTTVESASGFTVEADQELAAAKGKSAAQVTGTFSWRVVARPKTDATVDRLAPARLAPQIDFSKLPGPVAPLPPIVSTAAKTATPRTGPATAPVPRRNTNPAVQPASSVPSQSPTGGQQPPSSPPATGNWPNPLPVPRT